MRVIVKSLSAGAWLGWRLSAVHGQSLVQFGWKNFCDFEWPSCQRSGRQKVNERRSNMWFELRIAESITCAG
jgi:hypothetical protein